jgi:hypothetical protein
MLNNLVLKDQLLTMTSYLFISKHKVFIIRSDCIFHFQRLVFTTRCKYIVQLLLQPLTVTSILRFNKVTQCVRFTFSSLDMPNSHIQNCLNSAVVITNMYYFGSFINHSKLFVFQLTLAQNISFKISIFFHKNLHLNNIRRSCVKSWYAKYLSKTIQRYIHTLYIYKESAALWLHTII